MRSRRATTNRSRSSGASRTWSAREALPCNSLASLRTARHRQASRCGRLRSLQRGLQVQHVVGDHREVGGRGGRRGHPLCQLGVGHLGAWERAAGLLGGRPLRPWPFGFGPHVRGRRRAGLPCLSRPDFRPRIGDTARDRRRSLPRTWAWSRPRAPAGCRLPPLLDQPGAARRLEQVGNGGGGPVRAAPRRVQGHCKKVTAAYARTERTANPPLGRARGPFAGQLVGRYGDRDSANLPRAAKLPPQGEATRWRAVGC
jgi:hypothetical protein